MLGTMLLLFGVKMQQTISATVLIFGLLFATEELSVYALLGRPASERYSLNFTLVRGPSNTLGAMNVDLQCTFSVWWMLLGLSLGLRLTALRAFKRVAHKMPVKVKMIRRLPTT